MKIIKLIFLLLLLTSCVKKIENGVVVKKVYKEEHQESYLEYDILLNMPITKEIDISEIYSLYIRGFNGEDTVIQRFNVKKETWKKVKIGDTIKIK